MAFAQGTWSPDGKLGGVTIEASAAHGSNDATGTSVYVGKGKFRMVTAATVVKVSGTDEIYFVTVEANSRGATTTWKTIGTVFAGGYSSKTGRDTSDVADEQEVIIDNPYDYQIRTRTNFSGSSPSITYSLTAYPLISQH
jgi:hypothetical protein